MASTIESSYGAKLRKSQDLLTLIQGFTGYEPPRRAESVAGFSAFITSLIESNTLTASSMQHYKVAVTERQNAYNGTSGSIDKLLAPLRGAVESQYGKSSVETKGIASLIKTMRTTKLVKLPADPTKDTQEKTLSQSERSYGSIIQNFNNIINTLNQMNGYNPSNGALQFETLSTLSNHITTLNNTVVQRIGTLKNSQKNRVTLYTELKDRVQRIKAYVKAQYGMNSNEYQMVKGIKV